VIAVLLAVVLAAQPAPPLLPTPEQPVVLHLHRPSQPGPSSRCANALCGSLLALIRGATRTIDLAIYGYRDQPEILESLVAARRRGVVVRAVVDREPDGRNLYDGTEAFVAALGPVADDRAADLRAVARQRPYDPSWSRCWREPEPGRLGPRQCVGYDLGDRCLLAVHASAEPLSFQGDIVHHKVFVIDGRWVWTGSTNVSDTCAGGYNANLVAVVDSPEVAAWYRAEIDELQAGRFHEEKADPPPLSARLADGTRVEGWMSPQDRPLTRLVVREIERAERRIDVAIFFLTHKEVAGALIRAHRRGVAVRVLADASGATNAYTKVELLRAAGVPVKIEPWGGKLHLKAAAIDGRVAIVGSMNWTSAGEGGNDENTLVLRGAGPAGALHAWIDEAWAAVPDRWLSGRPDPESRDSGTACSDGVDNDHDSLTDGEDPGCGPTPPPLAPLPPYQIVPKVEGAPLVKAVTLPDGTRRALTPAQRDWSLARAEALFCSVEDAARAGYPTSGTERRSP
jgi:phosphatidylserine/phosphatidylglycerophosphate/cardiolipin synthase-like enzyme